MHLMKIFEMKTFSPHIRFTCNVLNGPLKPVKVKLCQFKLGFFSIISTCGLGGYQYHIQNMLKVHCLPVGENPQKLWKNKIWNKVATKSLKLIMSFSKQATTKK